MSATAAPLLTIGIPTYNRAHELDNLLASIVREMKTITPGLIDILVADNASEDNTREVVAKYQQECTAIQYIHTDVNQGMQSNFVRLMDACAGEYLHMIGDDEIVLEDGLSIILQALQANRNVSIFVFNYRYEAELDRPVHLVEACGHPIDTNVCNVQDFIFRHGWLWTLGNLGMVIVKTAPLRAVDRTPYMSHFFMQAAFYLDVFHGDLILFVNRPIFLTFVRSQTVNKERWEHDGSVGGWPYIWDSIDYLIKKEVLPPQLPLGFYNHCSSSWNPSWNLLLDHMIKRINSGNTKVDDKDWRDVARWIEKLDDIPQRERILAAVESLRISYNISKSSLVNFGRLASLLKNTIGAF